MEATCRFNPHDVPSLASVDVLLKAVGDTPIMKTKKWAMEKGRTIQSLSEFIVKFLKLDPNEQLVRTGFISLPILQCPNVENMALSLFLINFSKFLHAFQFIYVNQSFSPSPDQEVGVLFEVSTGNRTVIHSHCY